MRILAVGLLLVGLSACGPADSTSPEPGNTAVPGEVSKAVAQAAEQASTDDFKPGAISEASCAMLENGVVTELFGINPAQVTYRRAIPVKRAGHVVCLASWDLPDKAGLESAHLESVQAWARSAATGKKGPMPKPPKLTGQVSISLMGTEFDSAGDAVASLESAVATLEKGITTKVAGKEYESQVDFDGWIENVGDKAVFTEKGELLVADNGRRFSVTVEVSDDPATDRGHALDLARQVMESL